MNDMDLRSVLIEIHTALDAAGIGHALIGGLALSVHGAGRATEHRVLDQEIRVVDASDLIGLKVQSSTNNPARAMRDMADIERLLANAAIDLDRVRLYFRLFEREAELDALLAKRDAR